MQNSQIFGVVGQGYVGLEVSITLAKQSKRVVGFEKSAAKITEISMGVSPVENVAHEDLKMVLDSGAYGITSDFSQLSQCSVIVICVPTPITPEETPDLSMLREAIEDIARFVSSGTLIINESTSFPGTLREIVASEILARRPELKGSLYFGVAPERVSPGSGIALAEVSRVVSGIDEKSKELTQSFYASFCRGVTVVNTPEIAEAAKLLENSFRKVNIAFINEFNLICRELGIDTREVIQAAASKPYGFMRFDPGAGIGGHCIPVDPLYLQHAAATVGGKSEFIELATIANNRHGEKLLDMVLKKSAKVNPRILMLGVAYKSGISDTRESPAIRIHETLSARGLQFGWHDPLVESWMGSKPSKTNDNWDIALVVTNQPNLPIAELVNSGVEVYDFTGAYLDNPKVIQI